MKKVSSKPPSSSRRSRRTSIAPPFALTVGDDARRPARSGRGRSPGGASRSSGPRRSIARACTSAAAGPVELRRVCGEARRVVARASAPSSSRQRGSSATSLFTQQDELGSPSRGADVVEVAEAAVRASRSSARSAALRSRRSRRSTRVDDDDLVGRARLLGEAREAVAEHGARPRSCRPRLRLRSSRQLLNAAASRVRERRRRVLPLDVRPAARSHRGERVRVGEQRDGRVGELGRVVPGEDDAAAGCANELLRTAATAWRRRGCRTRVPRLRRCRTPPGARGGRRSLRGGARPPRSRPRRPRRRRPAAAVGRAAHEPESRRGNSASDARKRVEEQRDVLPGIVAATGEYERPAPRDRGARRRRVPARRRPCRRESEAVPRPPRAGAPPRRPNVARPAKSRRSAAPGAGRSARRSRRSGALSASARRRERGSAARRLRHSSSSPVPIQHA